MKHAIQNLLILLAFVVLPFAAGAQTTAFKYQGSLTESGSPANGNFQMRFRMFDAASGGTQVGATLADLPVTAANGVFSISLDFGSAALNGANRWLEISVRRNSGESYTTLSPREQITSSPYSVRTLSAAVADDSQKLGGIAASEYVTNSTGGNLFIRNGAGQQTAGFNISGNGIIGGNLGVGTASPQSRLGLQTTDNAYGFSHTNGAVTLGTYLGLSAGWLGTRSNHPLHLFTNDNLPQVTLSTNGNFGVGTSSPNQRLQVDFGNVVVRGANNFSVNGDRASVYFGDTGHFISGVRGSGIRIGTPGIGDAISLLESSGNIGIGTTSPGQKLEVNGAMRTTTATSDCPIGWFCSVYAWDLSVASILYSGLVQRSDARLKRNIRPLHDSRDKLLELNGVSYEWKEGEPGTHYGFIAQEVEEIFPDLVKTDNRGYKSVNYVGLIPFLVEKIKAQQAEIDVLREQLQRRSNDEVSRP